MFIDTHAHLNFRAYNNDLEEVIERTLKEGVSVINIGSKYETSKRAIEIAERYEGFYASIGLHPIHSTPGLVKIKTDNEEGGFQTEGEEFSKERYRELGKSKKVVAIGEIGLDYYYKPKTTRRKELFKEKQREVFRSQLELSEELNLPVVLHCRMAHNDTFNILKEKKRNGVLHCFTGTEEDLERYLHLGLHIGYNGIIFKLPLDNVIKKTPLDRILIETDCPYLTPPEKEGKRNEPIFGRYIIERIAKIKGISYEEMAPISNANAKNLFKI